MEFVVGRAPDRQWGLITLLRLLKLRMAIKGDFNRLRSRQTVGGKIHGREGNSPECQLKFRIIIKCMEELGFVMALLQLEGWLRSSYPLKKA